VIVEDHLAINYDLVGVMVSIYRASHLGK